MLAIYRAVLWMPFLTALAAVGCVAWLYWSISLPSYAMMLPAGFGIVTFTMTSVLGFIVRRKMIQAELFAKELALQALEKTNKYFQEQVFKAADPTVELDSDIDIDQLLRDMRHQVDNDVLERMQKEDYKWPDGPTTTSQSS